MIRGRDSYMDKMEKNQDQLKELINARKYLTKDKENVILFIGKDISHTYGRWVFAPQKFYITFYCQSYSECLAKDSISNDEVHLSGADANLIILEKNPKLINSLSVDLSNQFKYEEESSQFLFYYN
jgi:hypothetical protein